MTFKGDCWIVKNQPQIKHELCSISICLHCIPFLTRLPPNHFENRHFWLFFNVGYNYTTILFPKRETVTLTAECSKISMKINCLQFWKPKFQYFGIFESPSLIIRWKALTNKKTKQAWHINADNRPIVHILISMWAIKCKKEINENIVQW